MTRDEAVEAGARALAGLVDGEAWPTNEALGGHPLLGTRDDEYRDAMRERAAAVLDAVGWRPEAAVQSEALRDAADAWQVNEWAAEFPPGTSRVALILGMAQRATNFLRARADALGGAE